MLLCENHSYYTGYTNNLEKRFLLHQNGKASNYTRSFKPLKIAQCWIIENDKSLAMHLENEIKKRSRKDKEELIRSPSSLTSDPRVQPFDF